MTGGDAIKSAMALLSVGKAEQAVAALRRLVARKPGDAEANHALGQALAAAGQREQGLLFLDRAAQAEPSRPALHNNRGCLLVELDRFDAAQAAFLRAVGLDANYLPGWIGVSRARLGLRDFDGAIAAAARAVAIDPRRPEPYNNWSIALVQSGRHADAAEMLTRAREHLPDDEGVQGALVGVMNYWHAADPARVRDEHVRLGELISREAPRTPLPFANRREPERRLRIGYLSPDFRAHSVAYFAAPVFEHHDRAAVHVTGYYAATAEDDVTGWLRAHADAWAPVHRLSPPAIAEQVRRDGIDILVELHGHTFTEGLKVLARRPAPVQASWIGYANTTGVPAVRYRLADAITDPPGAERWFTEELVRLDGCFLCYRPPGGASAAALEPGPPPSAGGGPITFGSFNALTKHNPPLMALWARVLNAVPGSRLVLKAWAFADERVRAACARQFEAAGGPADRLELLGQNYTVAEHLGVYRRIDIALDTFPYNGTTTTCEALWMGAPVVTLAGEMHKSRVGLSLLTAAGLPELAATDADGFVRIAADLAGDRARLADLRGTLRGRLLASPLCDAPAFTRKLEAAYRRMWHAWCATPGA